MKILLVSTWDIPCGIAEHSALLKEAVEKADPNLHVLPCADLLDPTVTFNTGGIDILHLNYHAALHSRWTPEVIAAWKAKGLKVLVTYHDTGVPNSDQCQQVCAAADYYVVHERCEDLPPNGEYLRQGVPAAEDPVYFDLLRADQIRQKVWWPGQPVVGTVGFPFPWKNYDLLCEGAERAGWGVLLLAPTATPEQVARWKSLNPAIVVKTEFLDRRVVVSLLSGCSATAFLYNCANTGTSGAIRQGIAARKPVIAFHPSICRQFRDLDTGDFQGIYWLTGGSPDDIARALTCDVDDADRYGVVRLAHRDSWTKVGQAYARIYRTLQNA